MLSLSFSRSVTGHIRSINNADTFFTFLRAMYNDKDNPHSLERKKKARQTKRQENFSAHRPYSDISSLMIRQAKIQVFLTHLFNSLSTQSVSLHDGTHTTSFGATAPFNSFIHLHLQPLTLRTQLTRTPTSQRKPFLSLHQILL